MPVKFPLQKQTFMLFWLKAPVVCLLQAVPAALLAVSCQSLAAAQGRCCVKLCSLVDSCLRSHKTDHKRVNHTPEFKRGVTDGVSAAEDTVCTGHRLKHTPVL